MKFYTSNFIALNFKTIVYFMFGTWFPGEDKSASEPGKGWHNGNTAQFLPLERKKV